MHISSNQRVEISTQSFKKSYLFAVFVSLYHAMLSVFQILGCSLLKTSYPGRELLSAQIYFLHGLPVGNKFLAYGPSQTTTQSPLHKKDTGARRAGCWCRPVYPYEFVSSDEANFITYTLEA